VYCITSRSDSNTHPSPTKVKNDARAQTAAVIRAPAPTTRQGAAAVAAPLHARPHVTTDPTPTQCLVLTASTAAHQPTAACVRMLVDRACTPGAKCVATDQKQCSTTPPTARPAAQTSGMAAISANTPPRLATTGSVADTNWRIETFFAALSFGRVGAVVRPHTGTKHHPHDGDNLNSNGGRNHHP
jgi:hypothetical protein